MNAEAVKFSLDRHREMKGSNRRSELEPRHRGRGRGPARRSGSGCKAPFSPLTAQLADRAGMPVSPAAGQQARRQVRDRAGVRRAVAVRRARAAGPHRAREVHPLLRSRPGASSTGSCSGSSPTTTCAWPICAPATSTSCTRWRRPTGEPQEGRPVRRRRASPGSATTRITINLRNKTGKTQPARRSRHAAGERPAGARGARAVASTARR